MTSSVSGLCVAITGGARGIGREIAAHLAAEGAQVAIGDRDTDTAIATAAALPGTVHGLFLDVTNTASFESFLDAVTSLFGPIDVLVNNAGVMWVGPFDEEPETATQRMLDVNLYGVLRGVRLAAPVMRVRGRGHIVTIASAAARLSPPGESTYAATKHGVLGYLTGVREELRGSGVQLSVIMPGIVATELAVGTTSGAARMLQPADVARVVVRTIKRPRFEVTVPAYIGPLIRIVELLPQRLRDVTLRYLVPDQVAATHSCSARADYEDHALNGSKNSGD